MTSPSPASGHGAGALARCCRRPCPAAAYAKIPATRSRPGFRLCPQGAGHFLSPFAETADSRTPEASLRNGSQNGPPPAFRAASLQALQPRASCPALRSHASTDLECVRPAADASPAAPFQHGDFKRTNPHPRRSTRGVGGASDPSGTPNPPEGFFAADTARRPERSRRSFVSLGTTAGGLYVGCWGVGISFWCSPSSLALRQAQDEGRERSRAITEGCEDIVAALTRGRFTEVSVAPHPEPVEGRGALGGRSGRFAPIPVITSAIARPWKPTCDSPTSVPP